jgi:hypothetical protein
MKTRVTIWYHSKCFATLMLVGTARKTRARAAQIMRKPAKQLTFREQNWTKSKLKESRAEWED